MVTVIQERIIKIKWVSALFFCFFSAAPVDADIYRYIDENGIMHFTNVPSSPKYQLYRKSTISRYLPDKYDHLISEAAKRNGLSFPLIKAVIKVESNFNPRAVSRKGAKGLMQLMPENIKLMNIYNPFDPWENIMGGSRYLRNMLDRFDGSLKLALAGYNAGPVRVEQYKGIPPYQETRNYVRKVIRYYNHLKKSQ